MTNLQPMYFVVRLVTTELPPNEDASAPNKPQQLRTTNVGRLSNLRILGGFHGKCHWMFIYRPQRTCPVADFWYPTSRTNALSPPENNPEAPTCPYTPRSKIRRNVHSLCSWLQTYGKSALLQRHMKRNVAWAFLFDSVRCVKVAKTKS